MISKTQNLQDMYDNYIAQKSNDRYVFLMMWILFIFLVITSIVIIYYLFQDDSLVNETALNFNNIDTNSSNNMNNYFLTSLEPKNLD